MYKIKRLIGGNYVLYHRLLDNEMDLAELADKKKKTIIYNNHINDADFRLKDKLRNRRRRFIDIALNNDFRYFMTFTYDSKYYNEKTFSASLKRYFKDFHDKYILVPERGGKNNRLHYHVLSYDIPDNLHLGENDFYKWGRADLREIDTENYGTVIKYLAKYLSKDFELKNTYSNGLIKFANVSLKNYNNKLFYDVVSLDNKVYARFFVGKNNILKKD